MRVEQLMTRNIRACGPDDSLNTAARIMWEQNCGCVPVATREDGGLRPVGMITDRDICMAAYTQGRCLADMLVRSAMSQEVHLCGAKEPLEVALKILETNRVHRLPIVDAGGYLVGLLSLTDLAREAALEHAIQVKAVRDGDVGEVLEAIAVPASPRSLTTPG